MNYLNHQLLNFKELDLLQTNIEKKDLQWEDGKKTAGKHAAKSKNNLQLNRESETSKKYAGLISKIILGAFPIPKKTQTLKFSIDHSKLSRFRVPSSAVVLP